MDFTPPRRLVARRRAAMHALGSFLASLVDHSPTCHRAHCTTAPQYVLILPWSHGDERRYYCPEHFAIDERWALAKFGCSLGVEILEIA